jgi:hypothetical protein
VNQTVASPVIDEMTAKAMKTMFSTIYTYIQAFKQELSSHRFQDAAGLQLVSEAWQQVTIGSQLLLLYPNALDIAWNSQHVDEYLSGIVLTKGNSLQEVLQSKLAESWSDECVQQVTQLVIQLTEMIALQPDIDMDVLLSSLVSGEKQFYQKMLDVIPQAASASITAPIPAATTTNKVYIPFDIYQMK